MPCHAMHEMHGLVMSNTATATVTVTSCRLQVSVDIIPWNKLKLGRRLGSGSEGTVREARYLDAPVAIKEGADSTEIDMYLAAGVHDNLVGLRGLTQKVGGGLSSWTDRQIELCHSSCGMVRQLKDQQLCSYGWHRGDRLPGSKSHVFCCGCINSQVIFLQETAGLCHKYVTR
jgi:hypothetical protein